MPSLSTSLLHWPALSQEAESAVFTPVRRHRGIDGWTHGRDVEASAEEPRRVRVLGALPGPGSGCSGPDHLLEVPEDQPPALQHHVKTKTCAAKPALNKGYRHAKPRAAGETCEIHLKLLLFITDREEIKENCSLMHSCHSRAFQM